MASTVARATEKTTNTDYVVTLLKTKPGVKHTGNEISKALGISNSAKACMMYKLLKKHPEIKYTRSRGVGSIYWWEEPIEKKKPVEDKYPAPKNNEGYYDTTASAAIKKVDRELERKASLPKMGEVWSARHASGSVDLFYILWATDTQASGIYLDMSAETAPNPTTDERVALTNRIFATLANHKIVSIATKPIKYLIDKVGETSAIVSSRVKNTIARQLDIQPVVKYKEKIVEKEIPVEKIVEKIVEKPVEKTVYRDRQENVPEWYVNKKDAVITDLLHQIDIYKDMIDRLAPLPEVK